MKKLKTFLLKYASTFAALALAVGVGSSTKACWLYFNQPEMPEGMKKYIKED